MTTMSQKEREAVQEVLQQRLAAHLARCQPCTTFSRKVEGPSLAGNGWLQRWKLVLAYAFIWHDALLDLPWGPAHSDACLRHLEASGWPKDQLRDVARLLVDEEV